MARNPVQLHRLRLDIELTYPRDRLRDVPVEFNPHGGSMAGAYNLYYACNDWTIRTEVFEISPTPHRARTWRMIVESGHQDGGPRIELMSTSSSIVHESWAARKNWNDFAFHANKLWLVTWNEYFGEWPGGRFTGLPFHDRRPMLHGALLRVPVPFHAQFERKKRRIRRLEI